VVAPSVPGVPELEPAPASSLPVVSSPFVAAAESSPVAAPSALPVPLPPLEAPLEPDEFPFESKLPSEFDAELHP
jgi:hypothetical protein